MSSKLNNLRGVELKTDGAGKENPKYVDVLDEDKAISGQKFTCLSFISPEREIKQREQFLFGKYVEEWDMKKSLDKFTHFLNFIAYKYNVDFNKLDGDLVEFCKEEKSNLFATTIEDEYKTFLDNNEEKLQEEFNESHTFHTSIRGIKIRGSYPNQQEAELRCKLLREVDPTHDVYVGPVGTWMPFHPEAYKTGRVEYMEEELNQLMHEKMKNEKSANIEFEKRVKETKKKAMEDNRKKALKSNNPLTQMLNENGDLVSVANSNTTESNLGNSDDVAVADIRKELFEGDNVITNFKDNDHGLSELTVVKEAKKLADAKVADAKVADAKVADANTALPTVVEDNEEDERQEEDKNNEGVVYNDDGHDAECVNGVCKLPAFKKCVSTGEKGEIICECMDSDNKELNSVGDESKMLDTNCVEEV